jgi:hypothetical protein
MKKSIRMARSIAGTAIFEFGDKSSAGKSKIGISLSETVTDDWINGSSE